MKPKGRRMPASYYASHDVTHLAQDLLGKFLCTSIDGYYCSGKIVETEAYRGPDDKASHSYNNRRTPRTEVMYQQGGVAYVYVCYGIHHLMNVVTASKETAHAVLIRALEPVDGVKRMAERRKLEIDEARLTKGPGALSEAMGIRKHLSGTPLFKASSAVWIEDRGLLIPKGEICITKRIGVESAGDAAHWPWRYYVKGSRYVSGKKGK
jgi:DNA-3-methyladenine glycosylase